MTVAALWAGCGEVTVIADDWGYGLVGLVRDKETLEPLNKALVGIVYPEIPDSALIDSSAFIIFVTYDDSVHVTLNENIMKGVTSTREDGFFSICGSYSPFGDSECAKYTTVI